MTVMKDRMEIEGTKLPMGVCDVIIRKAGLKLGVHMPICDD
jgi:hypothetical protein